MTKIHFMAVGCAIALLTLVATQSRADYAASCASCHVASGTPEVNFLPNSTGSSGSIRAANNLAYLNTKTTAGMGGTTTSNLSQAARQAIVDEIGASPSVAAPVFTSSSAPGGSMTIAYSHTFTASGAPTLVGNAGLSAPFTLATGTLPSGLTLTGSTGVLSGTPTASGTFTGSIRASNLIGAGPTQSFSITISKLTQATLNAFASPSTVAYLGTSTLSTTGGSGTGAVTYSSNNASCTITGATLTAQASAGSCTITATKATDTNYLQATATVVVTLAKANQATLNAFASPSTVPYLGTSALSTTGGTGTGAVTYSSNSASCTIVGATLTAQASAGSCIITATKAADTNYLVTTATVVVTLAQASQSISFGAQTSPRPFSAGGSFMISPLATGGGSTNPVTYSSTTTGVCTVGGTTVSMVSAGVCTIAANQAADSNYSAAPQVTQDVTINPVVPSAPGIGSATPGDGQATVDFTAATFNGGSAITSYTLRCVGPDTRSISGSTSPLTVTGMTNLSNYACNVFATNAAGNGPDSGPVNVTPSALPPLALVAVLSRKTHGAAGSFDIVIDNAIPSGGAVTTESRTIGSGHTLVFQFNNPITAVGSVSVTAGAATSTNSGNDAVVTLTIPDNRRVTVTLTNVNGVATPFPVSLGFLVGDVNNTRSVNPSDISGVRARSGQSTDTLNFRFDINATGSINSSDISAVKARSGLTLPP